LFRIETEFIYTDIPTYPALLWCSFLCFGA